MNINNSLLGTPDPDPHIDNFEELYVLGYKSALSAIRAGPEGHFKFSSPPQSFLPDSIPRCMVETCRAKSLYCLRKCVVCGLAYLCKEHLEPSIVWLHVQMCKQLTEAKAELAAWTDRFCAVFQQHPEPLAFDRAFLKAGKILDRESEKQTLSGAPVFFQSPKELGARLQCLPNCNCTCCIAVRNKANNPHQQALDGYCEAYMNVSYRLAKLANQAYSVPALNEVIRMDIRAYRKGMSGDLPHDVLLWALALGDEGRFDLCWNALMSEDISMWTGDEDPQEALDLSGTKYCSPNGADNYPWGFLDPVGRGCIIRDLDTSSDHDWPLLGVIPNRFDVWAPNMVDIAAEVQLVLNFEAIETLRSVGSADFLYRYLPTELVLQIRQHIITGSPVLHRCETYHQAVCRGEDLSQHLTVLQTQMLVLYDHIDECHREVVSGVNGATYFPWMPRFIPIIQACTNIPVQRIEAFDEVLLRMPKLHAWIRDVTRRKYPRVYRIIEAADFSLANLRPQELFKEAFCERFSGDSGADFQIARFIGPRIRDGIELGGQEIYERIEDAAAQILKPQLRPEDYELITRGNWPGLPW